MRDSRETEIEFGDSLPPQHKQANSHAIVIAADKKKD